MRYKQAHFLVFILCFLLVGCGQRDLELTFSGPKIVLNAHMMAHRTLRVFVGEAQPIDGRFPKESYYDNAIVELWEGSASVGRLQFTGKFYDLTDYEILPGKTYVIKINVPGIGEAESKPVVVPPDVEASDFALTILVEPIKKDLTVIERPVAIEFTLNDNALNRDDYFAIDVFGIAKVGNQTNTSGYGRVLFDEVSPSLGLTEKPCYNYFPGLRENSPLYGALGGIPPSIGLKSSCFAQKTKRIKLYVSRSIYSSASTSTMLDARGFGLLIANYPAEYVRWINSLPLPRENDTTFPADAPPTYTNIIGGIGFVYATNLSTVKVFDLDSLGK